MTQSEVGLIDNRYEIVIIRSLSPFYDLKYDYPKHPRYKLTGDADKKQMYPFREKFEQKQKEAEQKKVELEDKEIKQKSWRKKRDAQIIMDEKFAKASNAVPTESSGGALLFNPQDAEKDFATYSDRKMKIHDANLPVSFDADYEFADGKEISDAEFLNAASKVKMMTEEREELVVAEIPVA